MLDALAICFTAQTCCTRQSLLGCLMYCQLKRHLCAQSSCCAPRCTDMLRYVQHGRERYEGQFVVMLNCMAFQQI